MPGVSLGSEWHLDESSIMAEADEMAAALVRESLLGLLLHLSNFWICHESDTLNEYFPI